MPAIKVKRYTVGFGAETAMTAERIGRYMKLITIAEQSDDGDPFRIAMSAGGTADNGDYLYVGSSQAYNFPASGVDPTIFYVRLDQNVADKPFTLTTIYSQ